MHFILFEAFTILPTIFVMCSFFVFQFYSIPVLNRGIDEMAMVMYLLISADILVNIGIGGPKSLYITADMYRLIFETMLNIHIKGN